MQYLDKSLISMFLVLLNTSELIFWSVHKIIVKSLFLEKFMMLLIYFSLIGFLLQIKWINFGEKVASSVLFWNSSETLKASMLVLKMSNLYSKSHIRSLPLLHNFTEDLYICKIDAILNIWSFSHHWSQIFHWFKV